MVQSLVTEVPVSQRQRHSLSARENPRNCPHRGHRGPRREGSLASATEQTQNPNPGLISPLSELFPQHPILCVHSTGPQRARHLLKHSSVGVPGENQRVSRRAEKSQLCSPAWAGLVPPFGGLNRTKRWSEEELAVCLTVLKTSVFFCLWTWVRTGT